MHKKSVTYLLKYAPTRHSSERVNAAGPARDCRSTVSRGCPSNVIAWDGEMHCVSRAIVLHIFKFCWNSVRDFMVGILPIELSLSFCI